MTSPSSRNHRINMDIMKLIDNKFEVSVEDINKSLVKFHGPPSTPFEGGVWLMNVYLPNEYPFKSPSVGFKNTIFHPNVDEASGSICLDVINQTWSPAFDLVHIFDAFLPQLLAYPNAADPLNIRAAKIYLDNQNEYNRLVRRYIDKYATEEAITNGCVADKLMNDEDDDEYQSSNDSFEVPIFDDTDEFEMDDADDTYMFPDDY